jgi:hypothetical protein
MRTVLRCWLTIGVVLAVSGLTRADEQADLKAIVDKAIKAHGGEDKLSKIKVVSTKAKGKFYGMGADGIDYTLESFIQAPDKMRIKIEGEAMGNKFEFTQVINGDKGWVTMGEGAEEMSKDQLTEGKANLYAGWVAQLHPLKGKEFKLAALGDAKVGDKAAVGVKVSSKDQRDVNLYFDKKTGLLLKRESIVKDPMAGGADATEEVLFDDYKEKDGIKYPAKVTINRDGKKYVEGETTEYKVLDKIDDKTFEKP